MDIYGEFKQEYYDSMIDLAAGKPVALAEVGALPAPDVLERQPRWTYFMAWSGMLDTSNSLDQVNAVYHAQRTLSRDDPRLAGPMEAIRKATAERTGGAPAVEPVTPGADAPAKALLTRLTAASGHGVLSGQENIAASDAASAAVIQAAGKQPAIFDAEMKFDTPAGVSAADAQQAVVKEATRAHSSHAEVSLSWHPSHPTDGAPANGHGQLTDFEWNELLTPGSTLNKSWCEQADEVAATLRELEKAGIAVLWNPLPESNGKEYWWAGRKGIYGSAALYRQLFDRLVNHDGLHNLVWVWEAAPPAFGPGGSGAMSDFFPGLLYTDALEMRLNQINGRFPADRFLRQFAVGKPIGVELTGNLPSPDAFSERSSWAWFLAAPASDPAAAADGLRKLYGDPRIVSLAAPQ
jgi:mannan endo-1,4-beta-mannosidase